MRAAAGLADRINTQMAATGQRQLPAPPPLPDPMTDPGYEPLRITTTAARPVAGTSCSTSTTRPFTVPNEVPFAVASEYMHRVATGGPASAKSSARTTCSRNCSARTEYAELRACKSLTATQYAWICRRATGSLSGHSSSQKRKGTPRPGCWLLAYLDDIASDLSAIHGIRDMTQLSGPVFCKLASGWPPTSR